MNEWVALLVAAALLLANAFFVGAEFAVISTRRTAIEPRAASGSRAARITLRAMEQVSLMMAGAQLGITACSLGLGAVAEPAVGHLLEKPMKASGLGSDLVDPVAFAIALALVVFLHVVLGEMVPKNLTLVGPDRAALLLVPALVLLVRLLRPAITALNGVANLALRLLRVDLKDEVTSAFTRDEVAALVEESTRAGLLDRGEHELLIGALDFEERDAMRVLIPLDRVVTVPEDATPQDVELLAARTGFSRFPVTTDGEFVGYLHLIDALETDRERRAAPIHPKWIRPLPHIGAGDRLRSVLTTMQRTGAHLARVVDQAGAVLGVIALEDVLEELVGEIRDETGRVARS